MDKQGNVKPNVYITKAQIEAISNITDEMSASIGMGEVTEDKARSKWVKQVDKFLNANGHKRNFK